MFKGDEMQRIFRRNTDKLSDTNSLFDITYNRFTQVDYLTTSTWDVPHRKHITYLFRLI
jgi:hypothetical protein